MPAELYDSLPNTLGGFTDTTQLVQIQVSPGVTVDATIVDRIASRNLARVTTTPELSAIYSVADLLAKRQQVQDQGGDPTPALRHARHARPHVAARRRDSPPSPPCSPRRPASRRPRSTTSACTPTNCSVPRDPIVVDLPDAVEGDISGRIELAT